MLKLWNTESRTREAFGPISNEEVRMYSCGPTVYGRTHIGNLRAYVIWDVLKRLLVADGYTVIHAMNITDVGHLTDDGDEGEDKMLKASREQGRTAWEIAKEFEELFKQDAKNLNINLPESPLLCRATEHIEEQIKLVKDLEEKGYAYKTSDGVYFDTSKFPEYGKLSGQPLEEKLAGARVEASSEKKNPTDFALWKFSYPGGVDQETYLSSPSAISHQLPAKREMEWQSPWGLGFPGWHVECSAMAKKYLGQPFDIHTGGVDHIAVHHENEIAQSVCAYGVPLANFWVHNEFLTVDGHKMSKSLGNIYTLDDCQEHGIEPLALRYFYLGAHYRQKLNFTWESAGAAQNALNKLRAIIREWDAPTEISLEYDDRFMADILDDINTASALGVLWEMVNNPNLEPGVKSATLKKWDSILGLGLSEYISKPLEIPQNVIAIADRRWEARANKDWDTADHLRLELENLGWLMEDADNAYKLKPKK
ncbi:MAG: cysteine--tRNA ligase [Patescibacteria group bacterium]|nr:cysteine--tRNA ligase [Patescibacteria group bacterium]